LAACAVLDNLCIVVELCSKAISGRIVFVVADRVPEAGRKPTLTISVQTTIIVFTNLLVAVISVALMMLVLWQAPRQRGNQIFALMMLNLLTFSLTNMAQRFVDVLHANPDVLLDATSTLYIWFIVLLVVFIEEFASLKIWHVKVLGVCLATASTILLAMGGLHFNTRPSPADIGGYVTDYAPLGIAVIAANVSYLLFVLVILRRSPDPRPRAIWPAMVCLFAGIVLVIMRPLSSLMVDGWMPLAVILTLPYNSMGLAAAAIIMGHTVLKYQLFDPMHQLNVRLEQANKDLEAASRLKGQFLANMSHELRTPLNSIIGYAQLTIDGAYGSINETQTDRLWRVVDNGKNLLSLINDLLDISRIEAGRLTLVCQRVNTVELIRGIVTTLESLAQKKGLSLACDYAQSPAICVDEDRARQVLVNIMSNAVKFTHAGGINIRTRPDGRFLRISVEDTGIGIPQEALATIFEEFKQLDDSLTRRYEGTGLGLTIARQITEMHGGRIEVESTVGVGSTFHVLFPLADSQAENASLAAQNAPSPGAT
jgi:signal transduction histidine kinase